MSENGKLVPPGIDEMEIFIKTMDQTVASARFLLGGIYRDVLWRFVRVDINRKAWK